MLTFKRHKITGEVRGEWGWPWDIDEDLEVVAWCCGEWQAGSVVVSRYHDLPAGYGLSITTGEANMLQRMADAVTQWVKSEAHSA